MTILDWVKLVISVIFYIPKFFVIVFLGALTVILSPILALKCFLRYGKSEDIIGYDISQYPKDKDVAFLIKPLMGFQTQDASIEHYWYAKSKSKWLRDKGYDQKYYDTHEWIRWLCRVLWLCRNPAYQFADWLGWNNSDAVVLKEQDEDALWKSGKGNFSYWIVKNNRGGVSFLIEGQFYYYKNYCIEFIFGYDYARWEPDNRCMARTRVIPFRKYPK